MGRPTFVLRVSFVGLAVSLLGLVRLTCVSFVTFARLIRVPTGLTFALIGLRFAVLAKPHNKV